MKMTFTLIALGALLLIGAHGQTPAPTSPDPATPPPVPVTEPPAVVTPPATAPAPEKKAAPAENKTVKKKTTAKKPAAVKKAAPQPPDQPTPATVKADRVNVRGKASLVGEVVTQLKKGETITVLSQIPVKSPKPGEPAAWAKIVMPNNVPVWVHASFVDAATKTVKASRLNVRAGPGENFSVIGRLKQGESYKELRQIDDWIEIETPPGTFGYVAADLVTIASALTAEAPKAPAPVAPVETVKVETPPAPATPTDPPVPPAPPAKPVPDAAPTVNDPPAPEPFVAPTPEPPPPRRVVTREGIVRYTVSPRSPSHFILEDADTKRTVAFLISDHADLNFHHLVHQRYLMTGEEYLDKRWKNVTVLKVETVEAAP